MASSLAAQLQVVAAAQPKEERLKGKASLLYEIKDAADIDLATIYAVGLQGERATRKKTQHVIIIFALISYLCR